MSNFVVSFLPVFQALAALAASIAIAYLADRL